MQRHFVLHGNSVWRKWTICMNKRWQFVVVCIRKQEKQLTFSGPWLCPRNHSPSFCLFLPNSATEGEYYLSSFDWRGSKLWKVQSVFQFYKASVGYMCSQNGKPGFPVSMIKIFFIFHMSWKELISQTFLPTL